MRILALASLVIAGCASARPPPPAELHAAELALARAQAAPFASAAPEELYEAEDALALAEAAHAEDPGSARAEDEAHLALRAAERALLSGRCAAAREALVKARRSADRLAADLARRDAFFAALAEERAAATRALAELREVHRRALATVPGACLVDRPDALVLRFSAEGLFIHGTSLLRSGADDRLRALARALRSLPASSYRIALAILDDVEGYRTAPQLLAARRRARITEALRELGVPEEVFVASSGPPPAGTQVDVLILAP